MQQQATASFSLTDSPCKHGEYIRSFKVIKQFSIEDVQLDVYLAYSPIPAGQKEPTRVIIKRLPFEHVSTLEEEVYRRNRSLRESSITQCVSREELEGIPGYQNVVKYIDDVIIFDRREHFLVLEYCELGDLYDYLHDTRWDSTNTLLKLQLARDLARGLNYVHQRGFAHRDIKLENIFLTFCPHEKRILAKLGDFGLACQHVSGMMDSICPGSPEYAAPELFLGTMKDPSRCDIWALGTCMFAIFEDGSAPYNAEHMKHIVYTHGRLDFITIHFDKMNNSLPFKQLITAMLSPLPVIRPTAVAVLMHPFFVNNHLLHPTASSHHRFKL